MSILTQDSIFHYLQASCLIISEIVNTLNWWVIRYLKDEFTLLDVMRYEYTYNFMIVDKVKHS